MIEINVRKETSVNLRRCSQEALDSLGTLDTLRVNGDLFLYNCTGLTKLPEGLKVNMGLYLNGCAGLRELPDGLTVGMNLVLYGCSGLTKLPEDLNVGEVIRSDSNTGFSGHKDDPGVIPKHLKDKLSIAWLSWISW